MKSGTFSWAGMIALILIPLFQLNCYITSEQNLVKTTRVPGTEKKMQGEYYLARQIKGPGIDDTYTTIELS